MRPGLSQRRRLLRVLAFLCVCAAWVVFAGHGEAAFGNPSGVTNIFRPLSQPAQEIKELSLLVITI